MAQTEQHGDRPVLVIDFGAQYAQLIARRVREARVFSEVIPHSASVEEIKGRNPRAIVLSGGPSSVYEEGAPQLDPGVFDLDVPVFGICYGFQAMAQVLGGTVAHTGTSEYGRTELTVAGGDLHEGLPDVQPVWMSHGDAVTEAPQGFTVVASSEGAPVAAFENRERRLAGVQYHPEVLHSPHGQQVLSRFLHEFAGIESAWTAANIAETLVEQVRTQIGEGRALCALSGGVDSAVAAALVQRAIGDRLTCVFVDHGLLRSGERAQVEHDFVAATGATLVTVDASETFLGELAGVTDPEAKRKIIGREFIRSFEGAVSDVVGDSRRDDTAGIQFLVQGTLYPDVVESGGGSGTANIKSHHNVGGLPEDLTFTLVSRCGCCSRTRSARWAVNWGCPRKSSAVSPSRDQAWPSGSSARSRPIGWTPCAAPMPLRARNLPLRDRTAISGSARWCCWPMCARSEYRVTDARTDIPSCCDRCPARTR